MSELGNFENYYYDVHSIDETNYSKIYRAVKKENNQSICLKVFDKKKIKIRRF